MAKDTDIVSEILLLVDLDLTERRALEKRELIRHGIELWTRTEIEHTMAAEAALRPSKIN
jgi:hypothetical protein